LPSGRIASVESSKHLAGKRCDYGDPTSVFALRVEDRLEPVSGVLYGVKCRRWPWLWQGGQGRGHHQVDTSGQAAGDVPRRPVDHVEAGASSRADVSQLGKWHLGELCPGRHATVVASLTDHVGGKHGAAVPRVGVGNRFGWQVDQVPE
jgi:hypothetical protein